MSTIFIFAGHHNNDPGAINKFNDKEADLTKELRNIIVSSLKDKGVKNYKTDNDNDTLGAVIKKANTRFDDIVLDIHFNAGTETATGVETYISNNAGTVSKKLAKEIQETTVKILGLRDRGVYRESHSARKKLGILNMKGGACLLEVCFITNVNDLKIYKEKKYELGKALAEILLNNIK